MNNVSRRMFLKASAVAGLGTVALTPIDSRAAEVSDERLRFTVEGVVSYPANEIPPPAEVRLRYTYPLAPNQPRVLRIFGFASFPDGTVIPIVTLDMKVNRILVTDSPATFALGGTILPDVSSPIPNLAGRSIVVSSGYRLGDPATFSKLVATAAGSHTVIISSATGTLSLE